MGDTCNDLALDLADPTNESTMGNVVCLEQIHRFRPRCCDPLHIPLEIVQAPTPAPHFGMEEGNEPICNICLDGSYPTQPYAVVVTFDRFVKGQKTCDELYRIGLTGNISDQICNPMVNFAKRPCGCLSVTDYNYMEPSPTRQPPEMPVSSPTASPSNKMLPRPTLQPTEMPVLNSTASPSLGPPRIDQILWSSAFKDSSMWKMIEKRMTHFFHSEKRRLRGST